MGPLDTSFAPPTPAVGETEDKVKLYPAWSAATRRERQYSLQHARQKATTPDGSYSLSDGHTSEFKKAS